MASGRSLPFAVTRATAVAGLPGAVGDDTKEDDDHAHEPGEVGSQLRSRVDLVTGDRWGDRMEHDIRDARGDQRDDADPDDERGGLGISPDALYDEHVLVIHFRPGPVKRSVSQRSR